MDDILRVEDVSFRYDDEDVLQHINFRIPKGAFVGLAVRMGQGNRHC